MNLLATSPWWLIALLLLALLAAAAEDALRLRISNLTCALVLAGAVVSMALHGFPLALWQNALVFIAILALGTAAFAAGLFGGGDIKLLAAIGLWLNFTAALFLVVAIALAGGLVAVIYIAVRRLVLQRRTANKRESKVPYGLAIVAGALFVFGGQLIHRSSDPVLDRLGVTRPAGQ